MPEPPMEEGLGIDVGVPPIGFGLFDGEGVGAGGVNFDIVNSSLQKSGD
jgi:hypothetical protein